MAVLGIQFVITMMMATVLSRVGPHVSLARWLLASKWENFPSVGVNSAAFFCSVTVQYVTIVSGCGSGRLKTYGSRFESGTPVQLLNSSKRSQNSRSQGFSYNFRLMIELKDPEPDPDADPGGPKT
jgi:hypothetical protein